MQLINRPRAGRAVDLDFFRSGDRGAEEGGREGVWGPRAEEMGWEQDAVPTQLVSHSLGSG